MQEHFELVKPACDFAGVISSDAAVSVEGGRMFAQNGSLMVSIPTPDLPDFSLPAVDLDFALRKLGESEASFGGTFVTLKSKLGTTKIKRMGVQLVAPARPDIDTVEIADVGDLVSAIDDVFPFTVGDPSKPWSQGARFDGTLITATNSIMLCRAELARGCGFEGVTLSRSALSYIRLRRKALRRWGVSERGLLLEFDDGGWALASRLNAEMPNQAVKLIENAIQPEAWKAMETISPEYRAAFLSSVDHTESILAVYPDHIFGARLASEHKCWVNTRLGEGVEKALFTARDLTTVITVASKIGISNYPKPVPFMTARNSKGLLAGRSA